MARTGAKDDASSYYPPRARWHTRLFSNAARPVRRYIDLDKFRPSSRLPPGLLIPSLALPGFSFLMYGRRLVGWLCLAAWLAAAGVFTVALGFPAASIAYGLVISLHAMSIVFLEGLWLKEASFGTRLGATMLTLFAVWALVYAPLVGLVERRWIVPLRVGDRVLIVHKGVAPKSIQRGDWLAYEISGDRYAGDGEQGVYLGSGLGIDPVLALPRDHVRFTPQAVFVNDQPRPRAPHMPEQGELVIPEKVWFIWPSLDIYRGGRGTEASISATMQRTAMVSQKQIIGRPFKKWFGRRQWP